VRLRSVGTKLAGIAALLFASMIVYTAEPESGSPPADSPVTAQELDFARPCKADPADQARADAQQGKRENPHQDPDHRFTQPEYPPSARRDDEEGTVVLLLYVNEDGRIGRARIDKSSGFALLDEAGLRATRNWTALPATDDGKKVCAWGRFAITFRLFDYDSATLANAKIHPNAARLLELLTGIDIDRELARLSGARGDDPIAQTVTGEVMQSTATRAALDSALHDALAMISIEFSEQEIADTVRFLESPVGTRLIRVAPRLFREMRAGPSPTFARTGCEIMQVRRSLEAQPERASLAAPGLPSDFKRALPRLIDDSATYCGCAAGRSSWLQDLRAGRDPQPAVAATCGAPPELKW
jgi:TonB family protein